MTRAEILEFMGLDMRQIDYYCCAGKYLKIFNKERKDKKVSVFLTPLGKLLGEMKYKEKQLTLISLILEHQIFADCFDETINNNNVIPETDFTATKLLQLNTCSDSVSKRRASTVRRWLHWIFNLVQL